jgi:hypothetical protein
VAAAGGVELERMNMTNIKHILQVAAVTAALAIAPASFAQSAYPTPEAAADALVDGIARHDSDAIKAAVGPDYRTYIPAASVDPEDVTDFLAAWAKAHKIVTAGNDRAYLGVGVHGWTLPIPIVKTAAGWSFDTKAAPEEMRVRRIGRNELAAIQVALAYTDDQGICDARTFHARQTRWTLLGVASRRARKSLGRGVRRREGRAAVSRICLSHPYRAGQGRTGRRQELCQERPHDRRVCAHRVAGQVR